MRPLLVRLSGIASGLTMMVPQLEPSLAWLQAAALLPILYVAGSERASGRDVVAAGIYMGIAYVLPQVIALLMPVQITLILILGFVLLTTVFAGLAKRLLRGPAVIGALAVGALLVLLDWLNFTVVPIWGTAQSFTRCWSSYPRLIAFVAFTGITGIGFVLAAVQALMVNLVLRPGQRRRILAALVVIVLVCAAGNFTARQPRPRGRIKVAALGWTSADKAKSSALGQEKGFDALFANPVGEAARQGARLVVSPEIGFYWPQTDRDKWLERFGAISRRHGIFLAVGHAYSDDEGMTNRLLFMGPHGRILGQYLKTHLTPFENFRRGSGRLAVINMQGTRVGGMICQDDNFTDLSRSYGREGVCVMAVPTLDWRAIRNAHLQSSIHRAIESRYAVVRAATDGISTIISPTGEVLARRDHFEQGPGIIVAQVPLYGGRTLFSILGHWPVPAAAVFLFVFLAGPLLPRIFSHRKWGALSPGGVGADGGCGASGRLEQSR